MIVRIAVVVMVLLVLVCGFYVRSETGLDYIPIRYTMYKYELYDVFRRQAGEDFEKLWNKQHPDRKINVFYEPIGGQYNVKLNTEVVANTVQDIFFIPDYFKYAAQGTLLDLTPFIEKNNDWEYIAEIYPILVESLKIDGHLYGLPGNLNTNVLYYNKSLFRKAGVPFPDKTWDWNDMLEAAQKLTIRDDQDNTLQFGLIFESWQRCILWNGGRVWSEDGNRCVINSPEAVQALQFIVDLRYKYRVCPTPQETQARSGSEAFQTNRAAMMIGGRWWTAVFRGLSDVDWSVAPLPLSFSGKRRNNASFNILGIYSKTRYPDIAYAFLKNLISPEQIHHLVAVGDSIPIRHARKYNEYLLNEPGVDPGANEAYLLGMKDAYTMYDRMAANPDLPREEFTWLAKVTVDRCLLGEMTPAEALAELQKGLQRKLDEYRTPVRSAAVWPYLLGLAVVIALAAPGAWLVRRSRPTGES